jgi:hypothetical protein
MRVNWLSLLVVVTLSISPCLAQEEADQHGGTIIVRCPPGCEVYLDGELAGVTTEEEKGKTLDGVTPGTREVRLVKPGHEPKTATVMVRAGTTVEVKSGAFVPLPTPEAKGHFRVGAVPTGAGLAPTAGPGGRTATDAPVTDTGSAQSGASSAAGSKPGAPTHAGAILFLRGRGVKANDGRSVYMWSLHGPDAEPQQVFACHDGNRCTVRYPDRLQPGLYRFRVGFRRVEGEGPKATTVFEHDVELDLQAAAGKYYVVDAIYNGDSAEQCTAKIVAPEPGLK